MKKMLAYANSAQPGAELIPELQEYQRQYKAIGEDAGRLVEGLTEEQFNWRAAPGHWSIAECLAHLNVTGELYLPRIDEAIKNARDGQLFGAGPFRHGFLLNYFIRMNEPPVKLKVKAPKAFVPPPSLSRQSVVPAFMSLQDELLGRLEASNGLHLSRVKVASPVIGFLKMSLGQCFAFVAAHERRHLWQAEQVRKSPGFP